MNFYLLLLLNSANTDFSFFCRNLSRSMNTVLKLIATAHSRKHIDRKKNKNKYYMLYLLYLMNCTTVTALLNIHRVIQFTHVIRLHLLTKITLCQFTVKLCYNYIIIHTPEYSTLQYRTTQYTVLQSQSITLNHYISLHTTHVYILHIKTC